MVRTELNLKQKELAAKMGMSGFALSQMEAGNARPRLMLFFHLSRDFDVNLDFLLHGEGDMFKSGKTPSQSAAIETFQGDTKKFLQSFHNYFELSPLFRFSMKAFFTNLLGDQEHLIKKEVEKNREGEK
jgi:transcriptional regulator with XRE-family HTH domain